MRKKLTIEFIRAEFKKEGYTLLTKIYENAHQKLDYVCSKGHKHVIRWNDWQQGKRCLYCAGQGKPTIKFIRSEFRKEGYKLLSIKYKNCYTKLRYICPNGHKHPIRWNDWKRGARCPYCVGNVRLNIEFIRAQLAKEGYILLTKVYKNNSQKLEYICPKGHRYFICWSKWKFGRRCPFCNNNGVSKWEKIVKKFVNKLNINYISNDKTQLINPKTGYRLELDMWFPDLNKAIECNGVYWHSKSDRKKRDKIKKQLCKDQGINLLVITDEEWNDDTDKCKRKLISFVKIGAGQRQFV